MKDFEIDGRLFRAVADGYECGFRDFRIRISKLPDLPESWISQLITSGGRHGRGGKLPPSPQEAAAVALDYWKDEIEESDRLDAEDSDRERREFEREQTLGTRDVL